MTNRVTLHPAGKFTGAVGAYMQDKFGFELEPGRYTALMLVDSNMDMQGAFTFYNYRNFDVEVMGAIEPGVVAFRPHICRALADYVFNQLGCVRVTASTTKLNSKARKFLKHAGFELEGRLKRGYDGKHNALIYGLLAENCRYLADR